jgi:uncharacterized protein (TIGR00255 family)
MKSMTGYGEGAAQIGATRITVQLRSLNHRHLDLQLRSPREYLAFEEEIRKSIREKVSRGRIEAFIGRAAAKGQAHKIELNEELLGGYVRAMRQAKKKFALAGDVDISICSRFADVFQVRESEAAAPEEKKGLFRALRAALKKLELSRSREGRQLKSDMESQLRYLKRITGALEHEAAQVGIAVHKDAAAAYDGSLPPKEGQRDAGPNSPLLRGDINEEVVRLKSHVAALGEVVHEAAAIGKKIDFMLQEIQRELNTISSKAPQLAVVRLVLDGKERVEKIREQAQNVE